jgi:hypothetical protein
MARQTAAPQSAYTICKPSRMTYPTAMCVYAPLLPELERQITGPLLAVHRMRLQTSSLWLRLTVMATL